MSLGYCIGPGMPRSTCRLRFATEETRVLSVTEER